DRGSRRKRVNQNHIARALADYYRKPLANHGRYTAHYGLGREATTSILTCPQWLDLDCPLLSSYDRLTLASPVSNGTMPLDEQAAERAAQRLVETLAMGTRFTDMPLYRLLNVDAAKGWVAGIVGLSSFVEYALTMDLLEGELIDAISGGLSTRQGALPL